MNRFADTTLGYWGLVAWPFASAEESPIFYQTDPALKRLDAIWRREVRRGGGWLSITAAAGAGLTHWMRVSATTSGVDRQAIQAGYLNAAQWNRQDAERWLTRLKQFRPRLASVIFIDRFPSHAERAFSRLHETWRRMGLLIVAGHSMMGKSPAGQSSIDRHLGGRTVVAAEETYLSLPDAKIWRRRLDAAMRHAGATRTVFAPTAVDYLLAENPSAAAMVQAVRGTLQKAAEQQQSVIATPWLRRQRFAAERVRAA